MSEHLYQLWYASKLPPGTSVEVNGPWDTYGYVLKHIRTEPDGRELHLIRGTGRTCRGSSAVKEA